MKGEPLFGTLDEKKYEDLQSCLLAFGMIALSSETKKHSIA